MRWLHLNYTKKYADMISVLSQEEQQVQTVVKHLPCVSVFMPFEPKMALKADLDHKLKLAFQKVRKQLNANYSDEQAEPVLAKLQSIIRTLDYSTYKKSIGIFVSPLVEKVYYLDIPVEEKIIIDESFEIRDLVYSKKEIHKYLVLVLSAQHSRLFLGNTVQFVRLASNMPHHAASYKNDIPERAANFSDPSYRKEVMLEKFLRHIDNNLAIILKAYSLPLFVMGTDRTIGHFKKITHHLKNITGYVHGNFEEANESAIREAIAPHVADWKHVVQSDLMLRLDAARSADKLAIGIKNVWKSASRGKGRLLVVEKNYMVAARHGSNYHLREEETTFAENITPLFLRDAVDDVIEKVLASGGDVEFVDEGLLDIYGHIALIEYYYVLNNTSH
jgi:hypothetical protein